MAVGPADPGPPSSTTGVSHPEWRYQLEIFALCGFAIAQPVLDLFGSNPEEFVFRGAGRAEIVLFALLVAVAPWAVLGGLAALTRLAGPVVRRWVQVVVLSGLAGLVGLQVVKKATDLRGAALAVVALAVAVGFGYVYARFRLVGLWARYASIAPVLFVVLFLVSSPTSNLVFESDAEATELSSDELPEHVVFLLFDELPTQSLMGTDGQIDGERFPNFRAFADQSTWYRNYTSVNGSTEFAVPALLSGTYPKDKLATAGNYPDNLFTLLGGSYSVNGDEVITTLCPSSVCEATAGGAKSVRALGRDAFELWQEQTSLQDSDRDAVAGFVEEAGEERRSFDVFDRLSRSARISPARMEAWTRQLGRRDGRTFDFLHLLLPHQPWHFYPSGLQYEYPDGQPGMPRFILSGGWGPEPRPAELGRQRHLAQVAYVDGLVGQVVETLKQRGMYDESLIVVTADHGAAFTPGKELRPGIAGGDFPADTYEQIMWSPLMIKLPHQREGAVSDANIQSVDLVPTIAEAIGVRVPWKADGRPASELGDDATRRFFTSPISEELTTELGKPTEVDGDAGFRRMLAGNQRAFAPDPDRNWAFYKLGPYAGLVGRPVDGLNTGTPSGLDVRVDDLGAYGSVDATSGTVPGLLLGNVTSEAGADAAIAVAVNGRIAGVSTTFDDHAGARRFGVLIPEFLLRKGANDIRLFVVEGDGADAVLHPLRVGS
jgi:hypothetical protein